MKTTEKKTETPEKEKRDYTDTEFYIKKCLINAMANVGLEPSLYMYAVDIATMTLLEREKVYALYLEYEDNPEEGKPNPYDGRLRAWNSQARACLTMLRLTPPYIKAEAMDSEDDDTDT